MNLKGIVILLASMGTLAPIASLEAKTVPRCFGREATIVGTRGDDRLVGTNGPDVIVGRRGVDEIRGRGGNDLICGNSSRVPTLKGDELELGDELYGGPGNDSLNGGRGYDGLRGGWGNDLLTNGVIQSGGAGDDVLRGGKFNRIEFYPGRGRDEITDVDRFDQDIVSYEGASGPVVINLASGVARGQGRDSIFGVKNAKGTEYADRLRGDGRNNYLLGSGGRDRLMGRSGTDHLVGGREIDNLYGGRGHDACPDRSAVKSSCEEGY
jgi:Ca2+-binding RTX toxin-like protein